MENSTLGRNDAYPLENFKKGVKVWIKDPEKVWVSGELVDNVTFASTIIQILLVNGDETIIHVYDVEKNGLPFLCNPDILLGKDDLTNLSYLHEPAVLNNLRHRFEVRKNIYTYCGIVLVAINPYADCSHLYGDDVIMVYRGVGKQVRSLDPHIYAIAEEAYFDLCEFGKNQSVIISGESGAGKTVSAKFVMRYLANVAAAKSGSMAKRRLSTPTNSASEGRIEERVLASNPIMEAIGNAKTVRNDNSSRFGKFIQINFCERFSVAGAEMKTYLLEKSRVASQSKHERNFHIFYQLCSTPHHPLLNGLKLLNSSDFEYTNSSGGALQIEGISDKDQFLETIKAFDTLNISQEVQQKICRVIAGVLYLGNILFDANGDKSQVKSSSSAATEHLCENLLEIDQTSLVTWLTAREIRAGGEVVRKNLTKEEATTNRDAIAKVIYTCLFHWIVERINENLMQSQEFKSRRGGAAAESSFIGVLDIYGFETFETNSFEQFCINYANEKLQQQFNQHVFKLEQLEYEKEGLNWIHIDFYDNQPCIDLIESNPGVIVYLDEQSKTGRGSDSEWLDQMGNCRVLKQSEHLQFPKIRDSSFVIRHFSSPVKYNVAGFIEKNKDTANEQLLETLGRTKFKFLKEVLGDVLASSSTGARRKKTVAVQFRDSLKELIAILSATRPHYIRCIKPNDEKEEFYFEPKRAIQQLRACGVLETVRISAAGFPSRWTYEDFSRRYRILQTGQNKLWRENPREFANLACLKWVEKEKFAMGKTKIFFRTGQVALLERIRHDTLALAALRIQCIWKGFVARRRYQVIRQAVLQIQAVTKAFLAYRRIKYLQMQRAAVCIQSRLRGYSCREKYLKVRSAVLAIQSHFRAAIARERIEEFIKQKSAVILQKHARGWLVRRKYANFLRKIIRVQCCARRWLARRRFRELKIEARSVNHLQNLNKGLENKIISLQHKVDLLAVERDILNKRCAKSERAQAQSVTTQSKIVDSMKAVYSESVGLKQALHDLSNEVLERREDFESQDSQHKALMEVLTEEFRKQDLVISAKDRDISALNSRINEVIVERQRLIDQNILEVKRRKEVEENLEQMREQLVKNANLLASQDFNKVEKRLASEDVIKSSEEYRPLDDNQVLLQQQTTINDLRQRLDEKDRALSRLQFILCSNAANRNAEKCSAIAVYEAQKIQDLELLVSKYKADLQRILEAGEHCPESVATIEKVQEENERLRDESIEIRALLANHFERQIVALHQEDSGCWSSGANSDDGSSSSIAQSEMDERIAQERLLRNYKQLLDIASRELSERDELILSLESRLESNLVHPSSSSSNGTSNGVESPAEASLEKLVQENVSLQQKLSRKSDELSEARAHLRGYSNFVDGFANSGLDLPLEVEVIRLDSLRINGSIAHSGLLQVFNVPEFTRILIYDLKPRLAKRLTPCLPAYLLLMAFRFYDSSVDDAGLTGLFNAVHAVLRENSMSSSDTDVLALWLVNSWRLLNLLRQYSNDKNWNNLNTPLQNTYCIKNFNLEPIRNQLKLRVDVFYSNLMKKTVEPLLIPKIVPAILQHESYEIELNGNSKGAGKRYLVDLLEFLNFVHQKLKGYGADDILLSQIFQQISHWICSLALNHMMFRKELCTPEKAISIKHNVTEIQCWLAENKVRGSEMFQPLIQASHLLQIRKSEAYLDVLCSETTSLMPKQILAILRHFSPSDGFEEDLVDEEFMAKVSQRLASRSTGSATEKDELLMRGTYLDPFNTEPFLYSDFQLKTLTLPACLDFQSVSRII